MNKLILIALLSLPPTPANAFDADKQRHAAVSALVVVSAYVYTEDLGTSILIALGVGVGKELIDKQNKTNAGFDREDVAADLAGIGLGVMWLYKF